MVVADLDREQAEATAQSARQYTGKEGALALAIDIRDRASIRKALRAVASAYGGIDILVNTAALFPSSPSGQVDDAAWAATLDINVTANYRLADEAALLLRDQDLEASLLLTSSANAVVPKRGSEAYDVSKAALSHLVRELATALSPKIRVNGLSPATVVIGSSMFGRDRVRAWLKKYEIPFEANASDEQLSELLADFYARRALTRKAIHPDDCARAILFLAGPQAPGALHHWAFAARRWWIDGCVLALTGAQPRGSQCAAATPDAARALAAIARHSALAGGKASVPKGRK